MKMPNKHSAPTGRRPTLRMQSGGQYGMAAESTPEMEAQAAAAGSANMADMERQLKYFQGVNGTTPVTQPATPGVSPMATARPKPEFRSPTSMLSFGPTDPNEKTLLAFKDGGELRMADGGQLQFPDNVLNARQRTYEENRAPRTVDGSRSEYPGAGPVLGYQARTIRNSLVNPVMSAVGATPFAAPVDPAGPMMLRNQQMYPLERPAAPAPVAAPAPAVDFQNGSSSRAGQIPLKSFGLSTPSSYNSPEGGVGPGRGRVNPPMALRNGGDDGTKHEFPDGLPGHARGLGGEVNGKKGIDKVPSLYNQEQPAFYTDKEYVASVDMLKKDPGLRDYLDDLREEVLAEKGMTPAEADAKAVGGKTLRANSGFMGPRELDIPSDVDPSQVPLQQRLDREGFLARNPRVAQAQGVAPLQAQSNESPGEQRKLRASQLAQADAAIADGLARGPAMFKESDQQMILDRQRLSKPIDIDAAMEASEKSAKTEAGVANAAGARLRGDAAFNPNERIKRQGASGSSLAYSAGEDYAVGPDGRKYLNRAVTDADHLEGQRLADAAFGPKVGDIVGNANQNLRNLNSNDTTRALANESWAKRGYGVQVQQGVNGPMFSNSTAPEKLRYTGVDGKPTNEYRNTQQYAEGVEVARKDKALADRMERDRLVQEAGSGNRAYSAPARLRLAEMDKIEDNRVNADKNTVEREKLRTEETIRMAPIKLAAEQRAMVQAVMGSKEIGNDPAKAAAFFAAQGRGDLAEPLFKSVEAMQGQAGKAQSMTKGLWDDMRDQFKTGRAVDGSKETERINTNIEERAFARLKRTQPGAFKGDDVGRAKAIQRAIADEELMTAFGEMDPSGFHLAEWLGGNRQDDRTNELPSSNFFKGTSIGGRIGGLRSALTPNTDSGDYTLKTPSGRKDINMGNLSADAKARLQELIDEANAKK